MTQLNATVAERLALVDTVDHLLNRGAVLVGHATLSLAGVDLIYLGLNLLVSSVETLRQRESGTGAVPSSQPPQTLPASEGRWYTALGPASSAALPAGDAPADSVRSEMPEHGTHGLAPAVCTVEPTNAQPVGSGESPERGLARLVLTLVELLRQLLERQAMRRMEGGSLAEDDVERMGLALMELETKMAELCALFGLTDDDLHLDLGPLGQLL